MSRSQQIIAIHDATGSSRSPVHAVRTALEALSDGSPPTFIAIDARHPYPIRDLGSPDWLVVAIGQDDPGSRDADWRDVIALAPERTRVVLLCDGAASDIPRSVEHSVDMTDWSGAVPDSRIEAVARRIVSSNSTWNNENVVSDALHRGALIHVGDGTTIMNPKLMGKIDELKLSKATFRILRNDNIVYIGDLVQRTEAELLSFPDLGRKRLGK